MRTRLRKLYDDGLPTLFSVYPEGVAVATEGLFGGEAGGGAHGLVRDQNGTVVEDCGTGKLVTLLGSDRIVEVQLTGGSGYGPARERSRAQLDDDVADGYVSGQSARRDYGGQVSTSAAE